MNGVGLGRKERLAINEARAAEDSEGRYELKDDGIEGLMAEKLSLEYLDGDERGDISGGSGAKAPEAVVEEEEDKL